LTLTGGIDAPLESTRAGSAIQFEILPQTTLKPRGQILHRAALRCNGFSVVNGT